MGGCATKPKVSKDDDDEKPMSPPPVPPPRKEKEKEKKKEKEKDVVAVAPVDSATKNISLSNLFDKESAGPKRVIPGSENVNASDTTFKENSQEAGTSKSMESSSEKFPAPSVDASTAKIASQESRNVPQNYTDALEKLSVPVVAPSEKLAVERDTQTENNKQTGKEEKTAGEVLDITPKPDNSLTDAPTEKIASQGSVIIHDEFTDALEKYPAAPPAPVVRVADAPIENVAVENTKQTEEEKKPDAEEAIENLKQTEEVNVKPTVVHDQKTPEEIVDVAEEKKTINTEDKKTLEENVVAVEKQIEIVESIIANEESDIKEVKSDVPVEIK